MRLTPAILDELSGSCAEFLIHAVDVEGKASGIEKELAEMLGRHRGNPRHLAGGVGSFDDLRDLKKLGQTIWMLPSAVPGSLRGPDEV